jgi:hypothetical protein
MLKYVILALAILKLATAQTYYPGLCDQTNCRYGTCEVINSTLIKCHCVKGVTGINCDRLDNTNDPCSSYPCYGGGACTSLANGAYMCTCPAGRTSTNCESVIGTCACKNGGTCVITGTNAYTCTCKAGFGGSTCDINTAAPVTTTTTASALAACPAGSTICKNGAQCYIVNGASILCVCAPNWSGSFCEIPVGTTTTTPAATTTTAAAPAVAACPAGSTICQNAGQCYIINGASILCVCTAQFQGQFCEIPVATTTTVPATTTTTLAPTTTTTVPAIQACPAGLSICQNGGTCLLINGATIMCQCPVGFLGTYCEVAPSTTTTTPLPTTTTTVPPIQACPAGISVCQNGGTCLLINGASLLCQCPVGFQGTYCEVPLTTTTTTTTGAPTTTTTVPPIQPCPAGLTICQNGGTCLLLNGASLMCQCPAGFLGTYCEVAPTTTTTTTIAAMTTTTTVPPIQSCPAGITICQNGGTCFLINGQSILCQCPAGFSGSFCEIAPTTTALPTTTTATGTTTTTTTTTTAPPIQSCPAGTAICQNGGTCFILNGMSILCQCTAAFQGNFCELPITTTALPTTTTTTTVAAAVPCPAGITICQNGGTCSIVGGTLTCQCPAGFSGTFCDQKVAFCTTNPCLNQGACMMLDAVNGVCVCQAPYGGLYCEAVGCTPNPCKFDQFCTTNKNGQAVCLCSASYTGTYCETII